MQRRKFIQSIFWLSAGLATGCSNRLLGTKSGAGKIMGRVTSSGKGISGISVSDGYSVVRTNTRGKYAIPLNPKSRFVFVSTPSGYEFSHKNYLSRHYQPIEESATRINFELRKLPVNDDHHQFIIWADPQVKNAEDVKKMMTESVPDVQQLLREIAPDTPVHGIAVGDIVWDKPKLYKNYNEAVALMGIPFFQVLGNHDMDYNKGGDDVSDETFQRHYGPTWFSFNRGKAHYIVLDDVYYLGSDKKYKGYITQEQLDWLQKDLSFVPKDQLIIVCAHIPLHNGVENNTALYEVLKGYKVHFMTGHTHTNRNVTEGDFYEHVHGTLCGAWWTGPVCGDGTPSGYGVYSVKGNEISWKYKSTGKPLGYQFSLQKHRNADGGEEVIVNVWNWDEKWKVEWWQNEDYKGTLENTTGFDPQTVALYKGDQLPEGRPFVEPKKTDHIFTIPVKYKNASIRVKVTDRFGGVYESKINV